MKISLFPLAVCLALVATVARAEDSERVQAGTALGFTLGGQLKGLTNDLDLDVIVKYAYAYAEGTAKPLPYEDKPKIALRMSELRTNRLSGKNEETPPNADEKDKMAQLAAEQLSGNLKIFKDEIDPDAFKKAFAASAKGEPPTLSKDVLSTALQKAFAHIIDHSKKEGEAFLAENKKKEGVVTTASGLQYKIVKEGDGPKPGSGDKVTTHYKGAFINGQTFDSSYDRGQPATFGVSGVIKGWTEALQLMPEGSKWQLYIPGALAYPNGTQGIPPLSTLIFDIELLKVIKSEPPPAPAPTTGPTIDPTK